MTIKTIWQKNKFIITFGQVCLCPLNIAVATNCPPCQPEDCNPLPRQFGCQNTWSGDDGEGEDDDGEDVDEDGNDKEDMEVGDVGDV